MTQHRAALFPKLYAVNAASQAIPGATDTDLTSLTALTLPVTTTVSSRKFRVTVAVGVLDTSGAANFALIRVWNGANGTKADTMIRESAAAGMGANLGAQISFTFEFTPGADSRIKIGLSAVNLAGNFSVDGTGVRVSSLLVEEVPA